MTTYPTLADLREGRVTAEQFLASRNNYRMEPFRVREITVAVRAK
jgi:hypothetical protein